MNAQIARKNRACWGYLGFIVVCALILLAVGIKTDIFLGDEIHHYRFAKESYALGHRATYDSLYGPTIPPGYYFSTEPLWPLGLAILWKWTGGISCFTAQTYHTFFLYSLSFLFLYWLKICTGKLARSMRA